MRPALDVTFVALLALTLAAWFVADRGGGALFWVLLGIAMVKSALIQGVFMGLAREPWLFVGLGVTTLGVGLGVGALLGA